VSRRKVALFFFIDAFGWEVYQRNRFFLDGLVKDAKPLETILGYSSACDPSIISGLLPSEHRMWSSFYYAPRTSPFRWMRALQVLPSSLFDRGRVRYQLSKWIKKIHGFTGYFMLYSVPFRYLPLFDYSEKRSIWKEGLLQGRTIFNDLDDREIPYYVHESGTPDEARLARLRGMLEQNSIDFAYISLGKLDALMHRVGNSGPEVTELVRWYDREVRRAIEAAQRTYGEVSWYVFTDHGMHNSDQQYDLMGDIARLGLTFGRDYVAFYDATMARFWLLNDRARQDIAGALQNHPRGRVLGDDELKSLGVYFEDRMYGDMIFLMNTPTQLVPSFMGVKPARGIHGFHPHDADSYASMLSNQPLPASLRRIHEIHGLMLRETGLCK
jgi:hypothetical protein